MKKFFSLMLVLAIGLTFFSCRYAQDASDTTFKEFKASTLLKKYEEFKDQSAALDAKLASIKVYEGRFNRLKEEYGTDKRKDWAREDREQANLWQSEVAGIKASYNDLASEYNANMKKFNYSFCNVGELPEGASEPLPREFKPYVEE